MTSISVWKDQILLKVPPDTEPNWPAIGEHAKFSERLGAYLLAFSKQNLQRIHRQFGPIPVEQGRGRIEQLKVELRQFNAMMETAVLAKQSPNLPTYNYKVKPIGPYQHRGVAYLINVPRSALFADCGVGKTYMVLCTIQILIEKGLLPRGKTLVCGKLATLHQGWLADTEKFTNLKANVLWTASNYKRREKILGALEDQADLYLINHEGVRVYEKELAAKRFQYVVVDESTVMKSYRTERTKGGAFAKSALKVAAYAPRRTIMSGTPAPNGAQDLWPQLHLLDPRGFLLEAAWKDFRAEYMYEKFFGDPSNPATPSAHFIKTESTPVISSIVNPLAYRVRIRDVLPELPERTIMKRMVEMGDEQAAHYGLMEDTLHTVVDDEHIAVTIMLAQIQKLRQITGGFILDANGGAHLVDDPTPKLEMLDQLLNEEIDRENKVVIFAQHRWEFEQLAARYKDHNIVTYYGDLSAAQKLENLALFMKDPAVRVIALHPKSCAHGVTLTMAHYMIFYSVSHSSEEDYQCIKRIERNSQAHPMFIYYLLCRDTVDEAMYDNVQLKHHQQAMLIDPDQETTDTNRIWSSLKEQVLRHKRRTKRAPGKTD